jgi:hypothetical protein
LEGPVAAGGDTIFVNTGPDAVMVHALVLARVLARVPSSMPRDRGTSNEPPTTSTSREAKKRQRKAKSCISKMFVPYCIPTMIKSPRGLLL